jgi:hypothetical protein
MMAKKQLGLRVEAHLKDGLADQAGRSGKAATTLLEEYIAAGLARDNGELIEQNSLPAIRAAVREEVGKAMQELYQQLSADLQKSARRSDDRLAALIVKAARSAGIGQRMIYALIAKVVNPNYAAQAYEDAKERTGKDIARPDETKSAEQRN